MLLRCSALLVLLLARPVITTAQFCGTPHLNHLATTARLESAWSAPPSRLGETLRLYTHIPDGEIEVITRYIGENLVIHVDKAHTVLLTNAEIRQLGQEFDRTIYPKTHRTIGSEWNPGIDRDPRVHLLVHDVESNGTSQGFGGYFSQVDESPTGYHSNRREIIYLDVFGIHDWGLTKLSATLAHEFGHLAHWYQNGGSTDESWAEEGMASFLEWAIYGNIHWIFVDGFFAFPGLSLTTSPSFDNRYGASFLLFLHLYEHHGGTNTIRAISAEDRPGIAGIQAVLDTREPRIPFPQIVHEWMLSNLFGGYQNLNPQKRIVARAVRSLDTYPGEWQMTLDDWETGILKLEGLPPEFTLEFEGHTEGSVYLATADALATASPRLLPTGPTASGVWQLTEPPSGKQVLLTLMPTGGEFTVRITPDGEADVPKAADYLWENSPRTQETSIPPSWFESRPSLIPGAIEPEGFLQMSNPYHRVYQHGERLYAAGEWGLEEHEIREDGLRKRRTLPTQGEVEDLAAREGWLYLAEGERGVRILNIQTWEVEGLFAQGSYIHELHLMEDLLLSLDLDDGLAIWDLQQPTRPQRVATYRPNARYYALEVIGRHAYIATSERTLIVDLDQPTRPMLVGQMSQAGYQLGYANPYLLLLSEGNVRAYGLADPVRPGFQFTLQTPGFARNAKMHGTRLYVADSIAGLSTYRLEESEALLMGRQSFAGEVVDLTVSDDALYAISRQGFIEQWPIQIGQPRQSYQVTGKPQVAAGQRDTLFVGTGRGDLVSITTRSDPPLMGSRFPLGVAGITSLATRGEILFAGLSDGRLLVWDTQSEEILSEMSADTPIQDIALDGEAMWVAAGEVRVLGIADPANARPLKSIDVPGHAVQIVLDGSRAYVAALQGGVIVLDRASHTRIAELPSQANGLAVADPYLCVADGGNQLHIYALESLDATPTTVPLGNEPISVMIQETKAYVLTHSTLLVVNLAEARVTQRSGEFVWAESMHLQGNALWVADRYGLHRLRLAGEERPSAVEIEPPTASEPTETGEQSNVPALSLAPSFPNPANPEVWIPYRLGQPASVQVQIYDGRGRLVRILDLGRQQAGDYHSRQTAAYWDGHNEIGEQVGSGLYFYEVQADRVRRVRKIVIVR